MWRVGHCGLRSRPRWRENSACQPTRISPLRLRATAPSWGQGVFGSRGDVDMAKFPPGVGTDRQSIMDDLIAIVTLHMQDRETTLREPIGPNTNLITDLDCTSWDL